MRFGMVMALLLVAGCAHADSGVADATGSSVRPHGPTANAQFAPAVDHHQHLLSPAAITMNFRPLLPRVEVPAEVADLLQQRAELSADPEGLSRLYTEEALFLGVGEKGGWIRGHREAAEHVALNFFPGYRMTPVFFAERGTAAEVAGYYSRGEGETLRHPGYFSLRLVREGDGNYRIASEVPTFPGPPSPRPIDAETLVEMLDAAGIGRAVVLSNAYWFDGLLPYAGDAYEGVRAENDWTAQQVQRFPDRLVAFCSFNPLREHAIRELERCARIPQFKGLKLHLGTSGLDLSVSAHVEALRTVFEAANSLRMPIITHLTATPDYGRAHAEAFVSRVLPAAPDIPVIIAHLWGGAGYSDAALDVYAEVAASGNPAARNLYFEVAQVSLVEGRNAENLQKMAERMRQIGFDRIFYGSDGAMMGGTPPRHVWGDFRINVPLHEHEFRQIAANVAPFLR